MTAQTEMLDMLVPYLTNWVESAFPTPIDIHAGTFPADPVLYLYLAKHDEALQLPSATLGNEQWDIWYVGETDNLKRRHLQHLQQVATCQLYRLVELLSGVRCVTEIDMSAPTVLSKIAARQQDFPEDKHNRTACRNSIGWSALTHVVWIGATQMESRVRAEEVLIAVLRPPLNWLRRRAS
jgi:hypothetical protein